jgi:hypothetical protein
LVWLSVFFRRRIAQEGAKGWIAQEHGRGQRTEAASTSQQHVAAGKARSHKSLTVHETPRKESTWVTAVPKTRPYAFNR